MEPDRKVFERSIEIETIYVGWFGYSPFQHGIILTLSSRVAKTRLWLYTLTRQKSDQPGSRHHRLSDT
jgi:hypothetical protein